MRLRKYIKVWDGCHYLQALYCSVAVICAVRSQRTDWSGATFTDTDAFGLMLIVVIPAILMAVGFAGSTVRAIKMLSTARTGHTPISGSCGLDGTYLNHHLPCGTAWKTTHALEPSKPLAHDEKPLPSKWFPWTGNGSSSTRNRACYRE